MRSIKGLIGPKYLTGGPYILVIVEKFLLKVGGMFGHSADVIGQRARERSYRHHLSL